MKSKNVIKSKEGMIASISRTLGSILNAKSSDMLTKMKKNKYGSKDSI